jgi:hypothetical protein
MRVVVAVPPAPVVTWEEADAHLKLDGDAAQQQLVEGLIAAATAHIDGPDGWLGRAIGVQTLEARFDKTSFGRSLRLPYPPTGDLVSVFYLDRDEVLQQAALSEFEQLGDELVPAGAVFPWEQGSWRREAVRVRYEAGYKILPPAIRVAILLMVGDLFRNRTTVSIGLSVAAVPMSASVESLLTPFRVYC